MSVEISGGHTVHTQKSNVQMNMIASGTVHYIESTFSPVSLLAGTFAVS